MWTRTDCGLLGGAADCAEAQVMPVGGDNYPKTFATGSIL
jgi:hypothetical protein